MTILLSHPEDFHNEAAIVNSILGQHEKVVFHLRKPDFDFKSFESLLNGIHVDFHPRVVIHQHHSLAEQYNLKGIHLREEARNKDLTKGNIVSTSFHTLEEAERSGADFDYFFCSPVFSSISKIGHRSDENWNISHLGKEFITKAAALGGIEKSRKEELKQLGFENAAVLGAVWYAADPIAAFREIAEAFDA